ncbi:hypothetical protein EK21DRAFT_109855 [Setomelanomma holmii]|uniref:Uncharacterized protein n=1 Tax=Setomelanomma holmii TaxID=210430 RepID=A0A9P4LMB3_9PLEO|nr:hypothetical protein EK21DRAFT_109855 [Setomelanomma holmii]
MSPIWMMLVQAPLLRIPSSDLKPIHYSRTYSAYEVQLEDLHVPYLLDEPRYFPDKSQQAIAQRGMFLLPLQTVQKQDTLTPTSPVTRELCLLVLESIEVMSEHLETAFESFDWSVAKMYKRTGYLRLFFCSGIPVYHPLTRFFTQASTDVIGLKMWNVQSCGIPPEEFIFV